MKKNKYFTFLLCFVFLLSIVSSDFVELTIKASSESDLVDFKEDINNNLYPSNNSKMTPHDLFVWWEENGYPDYVCGVWSTYGGTNELTIGITNYRDEKGVEAKELILEHIDNHNKVSFVYQKHSKNYLLSIMKEMEFYFQNNASELGLSSMGIYDDKNHVKIGIKKEKQNDIKSKEFVDNLLNKYGDALLIEYTDEVFTHTFISRVEIDTDSSLKSKINNLLLSGVALITVICVFIFVFLKRKNRLLIYPDGDTSIEYRYSTKEIKDKIINSDLSPNDSLKDKIKEKITKE